MTRLLSITEHKTLRFEYFIASNSMLIKDLIYFMEAGEINQENNPTFTPDITTDRLYVRGVYDEDEGCFDSS